jgi:hypothetical protein
VKYFHQCFTTILKKFPIDVSPIEALTIEFYTSSIHPSIGMFVKRFGNPDLAHNFVDAKEVEK